MTSPVLSIDTQHTDMIHDAQLDYYGRKLATASSDRTIKIWDVTNNTQILLATIADHQGPVWQVSWAHPKFGVLLASCSYDGTVMVHRETTQNTYNCIYTHQNQSSSMNSVSWAPHEFGLILLAGCADGKAYLFEYSLDDNWAVSQLKNGSLGVNSVGWAPFNSIGGKKPDGKHVKRFVTGGCDNTVRIWRENDQQNNFEMENVVGDVFHSDWVRDVAWAPSAGLPHNTIASCSEDKTVIIWTQNETDGNWSGYVMNEFDSPVWKVSWSVTGNVLAVSCGDHKTSLWKQSFENNWILINSIDENISVTNDLKS